MTRSDNGSDDREPLTEPGDALDRDAARHRIEAATCHLARLQEILLEMLGSDGAAATAPPPGPAIPAARLSRPALDLLAHSLGDPPLRNRPGLRRRGLQLVASRDRPAGPDTPPLQLRLRIDRNLRLCLDGASNQVAIEHLAGMYWRELELCGQKDGHGGVTLNPAALERIAGPLSPRLTRLLQPLAGAAAPPSHPKAG